MQDIYTNELLQNIYEGLVTFDEKNQIVPALAERWDLSPDGMTYTFHLRKNARFHPPFDRPLTAADVKYSFERSLSPETRSPTAANYLAGIRGVGAVVAGKSRNLEGVNVIDDSTLTITLERPMGYFLGALTYPTGWVVCKEAVEKSGRDLDDKGVIGTGPFKLAEYGHGSKVILGANAQYWGGAPKLSRIERPIVLDFQTAHAMYEASGVDACQTALSDYVSDQKDEKLKRESRLLPQANVFYIVMHPRLQPAFRDLRVRRAIAYAIDRDELIRVAYRDTSQRADSFIPPGIAGSRPDAPRIPYDPARAKQLLAEAGYANGRGFPSLTLTVLENQPEWRIMALLIRDYLKKNLGISINIQEHEMASFWTDTSDREKIPFYIIGWIADYLDPQDFLSTQLASYSSLNHIAYRNPRFDALCLKADRESDMSNRIPLYQEADRIAMSEIAILPLVFYKQTMLMKPSVKNARSNLLTYFLPHTTTTVAR